MTNLISAQELRTLQESRLNIIAEEELKKISKLLDSASNTAKRCITVDSMEIVTKSKLESAGYIVRYYSSQKDGDCYSIEW